MRGEVGLGKGVCMGVLAGHTARKDLLVLEVLATNPFPFATLVPIP